MTFDFSGRKSHLHIDEAKELARRLRAEYHNEGPGLVVATKIELVVDQAEEAPSDLELLDSEASALAWTIHRWLNEVGAGEIPDRIMTLRYDLDREARIDVRYRTNINLFPRAEAEEFANELRVRAGHLSAADADSARRVADALEEVLVGRADGPVFLDEGSADAVYCVLRDRLGGAGSPLVGTAYSLYMQVHDQRAAG